MGWIGVGEIGHVGQLAIDVRVSVDISLLLGFRCQQIQAAFRADRVARGSLFSTDFVSFSALYLLKSRQFLI